MLQDPLGWLALFAALVLGFSVGRASGRAAARRDALAGPPPPPPKASSEALAQVRAALVAGDKIGAIRLLREATGMDLKASKQAVEAMELR
jgi:ribosomal protein L7/L12